MKDRMQTIDSFDGTDGWKIIKPAGTELKLSSEKGLKGNCMLLDYDLGKKNLYVVIAKDMPIELPDNFKFVFYIKGVARDNNLEFKVSDDKGNTFWKKWENFRIKDFWQKMEVNKEELVYAWGPDPAAKLSAVKAIEFAVSSGSDVIGRPAPGGKGSVYIEELSMITLNKAYETGRSILENPSFEDGDKGWEVSGNTKHKGCLPFQHYDGNQSCGLGNDEGPNGASGRISKKIKPEKPVREGDLFVFSMWVKGEDKYTGKATLSIDFLDSSGKKLKTYISGLYEGKFDWKKVSVGGSAPENSSYIYVNCNSSDMKTGDGGSFVWFDYGELDRPVVSASSVLGKKYNGTNVILGKDSWHSKAGNSEWIEIDYGRVKKFSGVEISWGDDYAGKYELLVSVDGKKWDPVCTAEKNIKGSDTVYLDYTYARYLKIKCGKSSTGKGFEIKNIRVKEADELVMIKDYFKMVAEQSRDCFPRWMLNQQVYWATVGTYKDVEEAILCEDGSFEPHKYGYSVTPFLYLYRKYINFKLMTRGDVKVGHSLEQKYLPIPSVKWDYNGLEMNIKLFTHGNPGESSAYVRYTLENKSDTDFEGKLFLAIRPFQVYPPWQGNTDSFSPIHNIDCTGDVVKINNDRKLYPLIKPDESGVMEGGKYFGFPFKTPPPPELLGDITSVLKKGKVPDEKKVQDMEGFASAVLGYDFNLKPGQTKEYFIAVPLHEKEPAVKPGMSENKIKEKFDEMLAQDIKFWKSKIDIVDIDIPETDLVYMMKSNIGYNLVTKDGPALQPGARSYEKAWWRDGSIQASSLLKTGLTEEPRDYIDFLIQYQYDSGEVPPIIDTRAHDDPLWEEKLPTNLKEYDSQGEMIWAILEYYMFSHDLKFLESKWDNIYRNLQFMKGLREQRLTDEYPANDPDKSRFRGILPQSRSHEGYWFNHSYWDDWWAVKGWKDALDIAKILKKDRKTRKWIEKEYESFYKDLCASIIATAKFKGVDYISGCAEKGDFDPTSVAVAINYAGLLPRIKQDLQPYLDNTFDRYDKEHVKRLKPGADYVYTPYEARNAPTLIYMGHKDRALSLIRFILSCSRPYEWFQVAEVVNSDLRNPCYIGDMPHTWCGAEYMNSVRGLFLYEEFEKIILAGGVDEKWLDRPEGISVKNMPTYYGKVNYTVEERGINLRVKVTGDAVPPEGFIFKSPFMKKKIKSVELNGKNWKKFTDNEVIFEKLPAEIMINY